MKSTLWHLLVLLGLTLWLSMGLLQSGWFVSHDGIFHVQRAAHMVEELRAGNFPVRYAPRLDHNYGIPLFNYIYPGPYYLAAFGNIVLGIGIPTMLKLFAIFALFIGSIGWYFYFKKRPAVAWVVSVSSLFAPYLLMNIYVRFALGEIMSLALIPWIFAAQKRVVEEQKIHLYSPLPLALCLLMHNIVGYLMLPLILIHTWLLSGKHARALYNLLIALLLSSFFWIPMFFERHLLLSGSTRNYSFDFHDHFLEPQQWFSGAWGYGYSEKGTERDGITFALGSVAWLSLGFVLATLCLTAKKSNKTQLFVWTVLIALLLWLTTSSSTWAWELVSVSRAIQFPWRLLGFVAVLTPFLLGQALEKLSDRSVYGLSMLILLLGVSGSSAMRMPKQTWTREEFGAQYAFWQDGTTTSYRQEIVPRWAGVEHTSRSEIVGSNITLTQSSDTEKTAILAKNYFPSWRGEVDGEPLILSAINQGEISYQLKKGEHTYHFFIGSTPLETFANWLSIFGLAALILSVRYTK